MSVSRLFVLAIVAAFVLCIPVASGASTDSTAAVSLGVTLTQATSQLAAAGINTTSPLQIRPRDEDTSLAFYALEPDCVLVVSHSKTSGLVAQLSLYFIPPDPTSRLDKVFRTARSISFYADKSYAIHFQPPATK